MVKKKKKKLKINYTDKDIIAYKKVLVEWSVQL